jgi:hypothetical protein
VYFVGQKTLERQKVKMVDFARSSLRLPSAPRRHSAAFAAPQVEDDVLDGSLQPSGVALVGGHVAAGDRQLSVHRRIKGDVFLDLVQQGDQLLQKQPRRTS